MKRTIAFLGIIFALAVIICVGPVLAKGSRDITFAVFSHPHFYHPSLGTEAAAFEAYLAQDRKLIRESEAILDAAIEAIIKERSDGILSMFWRSARSRSCGNKQAHRLHAL